MSLRRRSREMTLQLLFQREFAPGLSPEAGLAARSESQPINMFRDFVANFEIEPEVADYAGVLFRGVCENLPEIDRVIEANARHWKIGRMSLVDLSILRVAVFEMTMVVPRLTPAIAINEAVDLAREFGSTDSASFVNGILDPIARQL
ncbi:MAG: transcription antitermination factor NusB [Bdellovibrionales bacterium]|jgi:N utilization substance protein B|nr:transcription antitermination factor NusB [Bdellovibrionales bacterium]